MVKTGLFKAIDSLIPLDEHLATFRGNGYSLKDKNEAKTEHENGKSVKSQSQSQKVKKSKSKSKPKDVCILNGPTRTPLNWPD
ncbi:hypothetical protein Tco_1261594 [Tanacetum coccineum]